MNDITVNLADPVLAGLICDELTRAGYAVGTAKASGCRLLITDREAPPASGEHAFTLLVGEAAEKGGADACLSRPFSLSSLREAVAAFFPPSDVAKKEKAPTGLSVICDGVLLFGEKIRLSPAELAVISALYEAGGEPVSRERLNTLLGMNGNAADVYICNIRKKLAAAGGAGLVVTYRSRGYALLRDS